MITQTICISGFNKKIKLLKFRVYGLLNNDQAIVKKINEIIEQQNRIIDYLNQEVKNRIIDYLNQEVNK